MYCVIWTTCYLDGSGRHPKFTTRNLDKIPVSTDGSPNFSIRLLPSDTVYFRGLPFPHVLCNLDSTLFGRGSEAKLPDPIFS